MSDILRIQVKIAATPEKVYQALTNADQLKAWFAQDAEVTPTHYNFWGQFTPKNPDRTQGQHPILAQEANKSLKYQWQVGEVDTTVQFDLTAQDGHTLVLMTQQGGEGWNTYLTEDFWFLSLENLRRYVEGKRADMRIDYTVPPTGDIRISIEIDAQPADIFPMLIKPEQLERWIASKATVEPNVGGDYDFGWGMPPMKILEIKENELFSWTEPGSGQVATWTLEGSGGKTRLTLVHSGFAPDEDNSGLKYGWRNFLNWIRSLVEEGTNWHPPVKEIREDQLAFYPREIGRHQHFLVVK
jgi:uncharacterized protein YndB with AHSA1/START domain